jgi:hypothetical protein
MSKSVSSFLDMCPERIGRKLSFSTRVQIATNVSKQASVEIAWSEFSAHFSTISLLPNENALSSLLGFDTTPYILVFWSFQTQMRYRKHDPYYKIYVSINRFEINLKILIFLDLCWFLRGLNLISQFPLGIVYFKVF